MSEMVIAPAVVAMNPSSESDWARAVYGFVTSASQSGRTVRLSTQEQTFSPREAGQALGVSRSTMQRQIAAGTVNAYKRGAHYRVPESEIARLRRSIGTDVATMFADDF